MQTPPLIRPLAAVLLCGLALSACGSDDDPAAAEPGSGDRREANQEAMLAYAQCMRENGIDMPDPEPGQGGFRMRVPEGTSPDKVDAAEEQCREHLDAIEPPDLTEEQQKEFQEAALAHARCMREHGIDVPDPTFGEDGRAQIRIRRGSGKGAGGPDPESPEFEAAQEACRDELPNRGEGPSTEQSP